MANNKECAGTYEVSGYTRSDGTKVDSYTRTCGAKHSSSNTGGAAGVNENSMSLSDNLKYHLSLGILQENLSQITPDFLTFNNYYKLSLDFDYYKKYDKDNCYTKFKDISSQQLKDYIQDKFSISKLNKNTDVVKPYQDSPLTKSVYNSPEFVDEIKSRIDGIKKGEFKNKGFVINFKQNWNTHLTLGHATLYNLQVVNNHVCGALIDYYDFDKLKPKDTDTYRQKMTKIANNNAYQQQESGRLRNYLIVMPIIVPCDKFE